MGASASAPTPIRRELDVRLTFKKRHLIMKMGNFLFSNITESWKSFFCTQKPDDEQVQKMSSIILSRLNRRESLGFFRLSYDEFEKKVLNIVTEQGADLSQKQLSVLLNFIQETKKNKEIQNRFWVQTSISVFVLLSSILCLSLLKVDENTQKALFGLIGTVLGYWLR